VQCVVVGNTKIVADGRTQTQWVLLVQRITDWEEVVYERIGIGILRKSQIDFDTGKRMITVQ